MTDGAYALNPTATPRRPSPLPPDHPCLVAKMSVPRVLCLLVAHAALVRGIDNGIGTTP